ncbi:MAG TPA: zinc ABC transporter substrate-binding protein [Candidatus Onthocola stercoravium]|nr:zinc ABC transporter substrate-binding protein [Candidatus Onthocola stercoravium]
MNLIKKGFLLVLAIFLTTGCSLTKDSLEDATIYTTVYPIGYLTEFLYSDYAEVDSIYPNGADVLNYELTEKQLREYAKSDLFIYNGLGNEKNIAKDMININDNLLIIDVSNGLNYTYGIEELWMSPNNYLMLAKNIKDYLIEYLESTTIIDYVKGKYDELAEILSLKDADLRAIGKEARENGTNTLIVSNDVFKYLENYGFEVISLDEETVTESTLNSVRDEFDEGTYDTIIVLDDNYTDSINSIIGDYEANTIDVSSMASFVEGSSDYITVMQQFIDDLRNLSLTD